MAGQLRNFGGVVGNIDSGQLVDAALCAGPLPAAESLPRLGSPLTSMRKLIAISAFAQFPLRSSLYAIPPEIVGYVFNSILLLGSGPEKQAGTTSVTWETQFLLAGVVGC